MHIEELAFKNASYRDLLAGKTRITWKEVDVIVEYSYVAVCCPGIYTRNCFYLSIDRLGLVCTDVHLERVEAVMTSPEADDRRGSNAVLPN